MIYVIQSRSGRLFGQHLCDNIGKIDNTFPGKTKSFLVQMEGRYKSAEISASGKIVKVYPRKTVFAKRLIDDERS